MSLSETEKVGEKSLASSKGEHVSPKEEKPPEGSFGDYLVYDLVSCGSK